MAENKNCSESTQRAGYARSRAGRNFVSRGDRRDTSPRVRSLEESRTRRRFVENFNPFSRINRRAIGEPSVGERFRAARNSPEILPNPAVSRLSGRPE